jgi:hypothetical protein
MGSGDAQQDLVAQSPNPASSCSLVNAQPVESTRRGAEHLGDSGGIRT